MPIPPTRSMTKLKCYHNLPDGLSSPTKNLSISRCRHQRRLILLEMQDAEKNPSQLSTSRRYHGRQRRRTFPTVDIKNGNFNPAVHSMTNYHNLPEGRSILTPKVSTSWSHHQKARTNPSEMQALEVNPSSVHVGGTNRCGVIPRLGIDQNLNSSTLRDIPRTGNSTDADKDVNDMKLMVIDMARAVTSLSDSVKELARKQNQTQDRLQIAANTLANLEIMLRAGGTISFTQPDMPAVEENLSQLSASRRRQRRRTYPTDDIKDDTTKPPVRLMANYQKLSEGCSTPTPKLSASRRRYRRRPFPTSDIKDDNTKPIVHAATNNHILPEDYYSKPTPKSSASQRHYRGRCILPETPGLEMKPSSVHASTDRWDTLPRVQKRRSLDFSPCAAVRRSFSDDFPIVMNFRMTPTKKISLLRKKCSRVATLLLKH